jgi:predicted transcriptional regulator
MIERKASTERILTINIDPELKKVLRQFAEEEDRTLSSLVKIVLRNYVKQRTAMKNKSESA